VSGKEETARCATRSTPSSTRSGTSRPVSSSHSYRNIERRDPVQRITSLPQLEGFDRIGALAGPSRLVVTGHDPEVARGFDEVEPGIIRIA